MALSEQLIDFMRKLQSFAQNSHPERITRAEQPANSVRITNKQSRFRLKSGQEFKDFLEARDHVLEHEFDFIIHLNPKQFTCQNFEFAGSQLYWDILNNIRQFLLQATSNITSSAFKFLSKQDLIDNEPKEYAAKNIMLNMHSVFQKTVASLEGNKLIQGLGKDRLKGIRKTLAIECDQLLATILVNLAPLYPEAPVSGGTHRMKEAILDINLVEQEENDLIFANGLKITQQMQLKEDYTQFIMNVINKAIEVVSFKNDDDARQRTNREKFNQFNQKLFGLVQQQDYQNIINSQQRDPNLQQKNQGNPSNTARKTQSNAIIQNIIDYFSQTLQKDIEKYQNLQSKRFKKEYEFNKIKEELKEKKDTAIKQLVNKMNLDQAQKKVKFQEFQFVNFVNKIQQQSKANHKTLKYAIGQKIPAYVRQFSRQQIANSQFTAKHSSILRIMTKWADYLQQFFQKPEENIYKRIYPFKSTKNQIIEIVQKKKIFQQLVYQLKQNYKDVMIQSEMLLNSCYEMMSGILSKKQQNQYVFRYSQTRTIASKINSVLTFLIQRYLNILIHHLLKAGKGIINRSTLQEQSINLVVFRVADLLRSKFQCNQGQFICLLKTLYILDQSQNMREKFKLVRIKNKLDKSANNIIINYLLMGKVQCQLQLSIQEPKGKQKNYFSFSHFVYELTRGRFGAIAECAIMISQLDPMIISSQGSYYTQKSGPKGPLSQMADLKEAAQKKIKSQKRFLYSLAQNNNQQSKDQLISQLIFECSWCKRLVINESCQIFLKCKQKLCNQCMMRIQKLHLKDQSIKMDINKWTAQDSVRKISYWKKVKQALEPNYLSQMQLNDFRNMLQKQNQNRSIHQSMPKNVYEIKKMNQLQLSENQLIMLDKICRQSRLYPFLCLLKVNDRGQLELNLAIRSQYEVRIFIVRVDPKIFETYLKPNLNSNFNQLDVIDLVKLIEKQKQTNQQYLLFEVVNIQNIKNYIGFKQISVQKLKQNCSNFTQAFLQFRETKNLIKSIKDKCGIINTKENQRKQKMFEQILEAYSDNKLNTSLLKYKKHKNLQLNSIKEIQAECFNSQTSRFLNLLSKVSSLKTLSIRKEDPKQQYAQRYIPIKFKPSCLINRMEFYFIEINNLYLTGCQQNIEYIKLINNGLNSIVFNLDQTQFKSFRFLEVRFNYITSIDLKKISSNVEQIILSNNKRLSNVDLCYKFPKLKRLVLSNNKIQSINFGNNQPINVESYSDFPCLEQLDLSSNQITNLYFQNPFPKFIVWKSFNQLNNLKILNLNHNKLQKINLGDKFSGLKILMAEGSAQQRQINEINIGKSQLEQIHLCHTNIKSIGLSQVAKSLNYLNLNGCVNLQNIFISKNSNYIRLSNVILTNTQLNPQQLQAFLKSASSIKYLSIDYPMIQNVDLTYLKLKILEIYNCPEQNCQPLLSNHLGSQCHINKIKSRKT